MAISRRTVIHFGAAFALLSPVMATAQDTILKQRTSGQLPRSELIEGEGWQGYEIDLTNAIFESIDVDADVEFGRFFNWGRALREVEHGGLHIMNGVSYRDERALFMDYIGSTDIEDTYLVSLAETETGSIETLDDLAAFDLPLQVNFAAAWNLEFDDAIATNPEYARNFSNLSGSAYDNRDEFLTSTMGRIVNKRLSGAILTYYTAFDLVDLADGLGFEPEQFKLTRIDAFGSTETHFILSKHVSEDLRADVRTSFENLVASGRATEIWEKWYGERPAPSWQPPIVNGD